MNRFEGFLLATDVDGTMLANDKSLSAENKQAIEYFKSEGGIFTFITGRTPIGIRPLCELVEPNAPVGCMNGSGIYDLEKSEMVWNVSLPSSVIPIIEFVERECPNVGIEVMTKTRAVFCRKNDYTIRHMHTECLPDIEGDYRCIGEPLMKVFFAAAKQDIDHLASRLASNPRTAEFNLMRSHDIYYEIVPQGMSKGTILKKLPDFIEAPITKTVAVGDNDNDAEMIAAADIGFAVDNASPLAKSRAKFITVSNNNSAIARIIERI